MKFVLIFAAWFFVMPLRVEKSDVLATHGFVSFRAEAGTGEKKKILTLIFYPDELHSGIGFENTRRVPLQGDEFMRAKDLALKYLQNELDSIKTELPKPYPIDKDNKLLVFVAQNRKDVSASIERIPRDFTEVLLLAEESIGESNLYLEYLKLIEADNQAVEATGASAPVASP